MLDILEKVLALRSSHLFAALPAEVLLPIANFCSELEVESGELLMEAGETGDSLYILIDGSVRVERDGATLAVLGAGECVGEMAALDWEPRSASVIAEETSRLVRLDRDDLLDLLADHPQLVVGLAEVLVGRLRKMQS